jgi:N-carbamoyl-L-amino-acid hydrolase
VRNVVPGHIEVELDIRGITREMMDTVINRVRSALQDVTTAHSVETSADRYRDDPPTKMSDACLDDTTAAADAAGVATRQPHSTAMHNTATIGGVTDTGLLFATFTDSLSHTPKEWREWDDCAAATRVLAGAAARVADGEAR